MAIVVDWKIKSRSGICSLTEKPFQDEEAFFTCIFDDPESDGFIRRDFSLEAWQEIGGKLEPAPFSFWRSVYKVERENKNEDSLKQNSAEGMLDRMIEEDDPSTENARFILALMLERKKVLIPVEKKETGERKLLFYEHKSNGSVYIVTDPELRLDEIGSIQEEVSELLQSAEGKGLNTTEGNAEAGESDELANQDGNSDGGEAEEDSKESTQPEQ